VKIYQFMKVPTARFGEHRAFEWLAQAGSPPGRSQGGPAPLGGSDPRSGGAWGEPIIEGLGDGFSWKSQDLEHSAQLARDGWEKASATILAGEHFLVVLDEITYPLIYGWLPLEGVLQTLRERPSHVHVCLTGRRCPPEIVALADTVTEMTKVKHAFNAGIPAQRGIED
jgi:cob(I)alamin adenosyltransferase